VFVSDRKLDGGDVKMWELRSLNEYWEIGTVLSRIDRLQIGAGGV
jgi:hypothetical protein